MYLADCHIVNNHTCLVANLMDVNQDFCAHKLQIKNKVKNPGNDHLKVKMKTKENSVCVIFFRCLDVLGTLPCTR